MNVKVMIKRTIPKGKDRELLTLIARLRAKATHKRGYVSGETLWSIDKPNEYLVISTWRSLADWQAWLNSEERDEIQKKIDALAESETQYEVYHYPAPADDIPEALPML